jgi:hypothetical protein
MFTSPFRVEGNAAHQVVIAAARQLFAASGFFQTKVEQIAKLGRVSPATHDYGIDGLLRPRRVRLVVERSSEWLLARVSAAVLRSPAEALSPN